MSDSSAPIKVPAVWLVALGGVALACFIVWGVGVSTPALCRRKCSDEVNKQPPHVAMLAGTRARDAVPPQFYAMHHA